MIRGLLTRARAITARCFSPPDRSVALFLALSARPSCSSAPVARRLRSLRGTPAIFSGRITFSNTLWEEVRKNCWKTNPNVLLRIAFRRCPRSIRVSSPSSAIVPEVGSSMRASRCMRVDFPDPLFPTMARLSPAWMSKLTPRSASKLLSPFPYVFARSRTDKSGADGTAEAARGGVEAPDVICSVFLRASLYTSPGRRHLPSLLAVPHLRYAGCRSKWMPHRALPGRLEVWTRRPQR